MATIGEMVGKVTADISQFDKSMDSVVNKASSTSTASSKVVAGIGTALNAVAIAAVAVGTATATAFIAIVKSGITISAQLETARQGFVALLGSAEDADATMARIKKEAAATPFEMTGLVAGTQALTAITKDGDKAIDILLDVGKAISTSGKGQAELDRVVLNLQQISSTGKVTAMDIRQFQSAIPMFNDILKYSGLTVETLQESSNGANLLFDAFAKAGAEGGITAEGFTSQAGTWNQVISNLKDNWSIFTSDFVKQTGIFDFAKGVLGKGMNFLSENGQGFIDTFNKAITTITDFIEKAKESELVKNIFETIKVVIDGLKAGWDAMSTAIKFMWEEYIKPAIDKLGETFTKIFGEATGEGESFKNFMLILGKVIGFIIGAIITIIITLIDWVLRAFITVKDFTGKIKERFTDAKDTVIQIFNTVKDKIVEIWNSIVEKIQGFATKIKNAITKPFTDAKESVSKIASDIKDALDKINPFHKESPSLIENIQKGVGIIEDEYAKLGNISLNPIAHTAVLGNIGSAGGINLSINLDGANISSPEVAQDYAETIGDAIISKLRTNRRAYA